jgi:hypothetical protein
MNRLLERASFAISRPDLLLRKVLGKNLIEIELYEIAPYLTDSPVILEAGACDGADTVKFAQRWPDATIYAFETLIGKLFHVGYTVEGTWKLMRRHGWSCQVPVRQAIERHEAAAAVWKAEVWPQIKVPRATWAV